MRESEVFKRLTSTLSIQERKNLLEKIKIPESAEQSIEQIDELNEKRELNIEEIFKKFTLLRKIIVFLKTVFFKKSKEEVVENDMLHEIEIKLEKNHPELLDSSQRVFLPRFYEELKELQIYISRVRPTIDFARDKRRKDFLLFLGTFELEDFSRTIIENTDPEKMYDDDTSEELSDVKRQIEKNMDDAFGFLYPDDKERMYTHAKIFFNLCELVSFPVESMLSFFKCIDGKAQPCLMKDVRKYFLNFVDHINSIKMFPGDTLLQALYFFRKESSDDEKDDETVEEELKRFLLDMRNLFSSINHVKRDLHIIDIARMISRRVSYKPGDISGGEDWYNLFRAAWEEKINAIFEGYRHKRLIKQHIAEAITYLGTPGIPHLDYYKKSRWVEIYEIGYGLSTGFIKHFLQTIMLNDLMPVIKKILIDGEFYKEQNREELTNSVNNMNQCTERIRLLDRDLSPNGTIGSDIEAFKKELAAENLRRKKIQTRLESLDDKAEYIIRDFLKAGIKISKVLQGIIYGQQKGSYDTLSNIGDLNRKNHKNMLPVIDSIYMRMDNALKIITNLFDMEREK